MPPLEDLEIGEIPQAWEVHTFTGVIGETKILACAPCSRLHPESIFEAYKYRVHCGYDIRFN